MKMIEPKDLFVRSPVDLGDYFNNREHKYWTMENGYAFANRRGLQQITKQIEGLTPAEYEQLKGKLSIGLQIDTEVTISAHQHTVTQAYCSALPIGYSDIATNQWETFARLILEGLYESTFYAALRNYERTGNQELYLTLVGGGVFRNPTPWILDAIEHSVIKFRNTPLKVKVVSYGSSNDQLAAFLGRLEARGFGRSY